MSDILLLNGPNLNLLGQREPHLYGSSTLTDIEQQSITSAQKLGLSMHCFQSNSESKLIEQIHSTLDDDTRIILFNPASFTHTSIALRDALLAVKTPFIELHLSNIQCREEFRQYSYMSDIAIGTISGFGENSYGLAIHAAADWLNKNNH